MKSAVFPGSFDPFTKGHENVVQRGMHVFDEIIVAIGVNSSKQYLFDLERRKAWVESVFKDAPKVKVVTFEGLTVDLCRRLGAGFILRGLRSPADFQYESNIAHMNSGLDPSIQTVFVQCDPELSAINARIVREIYKNGGDVSNFLPNSIDLNGAI